MRITNGMLHNTTLNGLYSNMGNLNKLFNQMSTGKKIQTVSDDPIIAGRALKLKVTVLETEQYQKNTKEATSWMEITEAALSNITKITQSIREKIVHAATDTLTPEDKAVLESDIKELWGQLQQEANVSYAGRYVFSGFKTSEPLMLDKDMTLEKAMNVFKDMAIAEGTKLGDGSVVAAGSTWADGSILSDGTKLAEDTTLGSGTKLGDGTVLNSGTVLGDGTKLGEGTVLGEDTILGSGTVLGKGTEIGEGTVLGKGTVISADDALALGLIAEKTEGENTYTLEADHTVAAGGLTLQGNATLNGATTLKGDTTVAGETVLKGETTLVADTALKGETTVKGTTTLKGETTLVGNTVLKGASVITNEITIGGGTSIAGGSVLKEGSTLAEGSTLPKGALNPKVHGQISGQDIQYEVGISNNIPVNTLGMDKIFSQMMSEMEEIFNIVEGAQGENPTYSTKELQEMFNDKLKTFDDILSQVSEKTTELGSRMKRVEYVESRLVDDHTNFKSLLSETEDIDVEKTYVEFNSQYAVYQAALQATSKVIMNTLADYL